MTFTRSGGMHRWVPVLASVRGPGLCLILSLLAFTAGTAEETESRPMLYQNLPIERADAPDGHGAAMRHLVKIFTIRGLHDLKTDETISKGATILLVLPGALPWPGTAKDSERSVRSLLSHVEAGGGLVILSTAGRDKEDGAIRDRILMPLGLMQGPRRTGPKRLRLPPSPELIAGLTISTPGLNLFDMEESAGLVDPGLVPNDPAQETSPASAPDYAGLALVLGKFGAGRVVAVADAEWASNSVIEGRGSKAPKGSHDNLLLLEKLVSWASNKN